MSAQIGELVPIRLTPGWSSCAAGRRPRAADARRGARSTCRPSTATRSSTRRSTSGTARPWLAGQVPYRDFGLEYPPGALPVFLLPTLGPAEHYRSIFEALMWICAAALLVIVVALGRRRSARSPRRLLAMRGRPRALPARARLRSCSPATTSGRRCSPPPRSPRSCRGVLGSGWPCSASPSPRRSTRSSSCRRFSSTWRVGDGRREAGIGLGAFACGARGDRRAVRAHRPATASWDSVRAPARPAAPDREPRRLAAPRRAPARPLRADGRLDARLAEPRRLAPRRSRDRADRAAGGRARRWSGCCSPAARASAGRLVAALRRGRWSSSSPSGRCSRRSSSSGSSRSCRWSPGGVGLAAAGSPRRRPRPDAALVPDPLLGHRRPAAGAAGSSSSATSLLVALAVVLAVATARARAPARSP